MRKVNLKKMLSRGERGQSLVEMALGFTVLITILSGVLDLGRAYVTYLALQNAAAEGAIYASLHPSWVTDADQADPQNIEYRAKTENGALNPDDMAVAVFADGTDGVIVEVSYDFKLVAPITNMIVGDGTMTITAQARQELQA